MRFQGENCTLSFGLHFDNGQVSLNGTLWLQPSADAQPRPEPSRLRFNRLLPETDLVRLQRWLADGPTEALLLPDPIRHIKRLSAPDELTVRLEVELGFEQVPPWWNWAISFPLRVLLEVRPNEYAYLIKSLDREHWSTNLTW